MWWVKWAIKPDSHHNCLKIQALDITSSQMSALIFIAGLNRCLSHQFKHMVMPDLGTSRVFQSPRVRGCGRECHGPCGSWVWCFCGQDSPLVTKLPFVTLDLFYSMLTACLYSIINTIGVVKVSPQFKSIWPWVPELYDSQSRVLLTCLSEFVINFHKLSFHFSD